jgi:hypothetical protein
MWFLLWAIPLAFILLTVLVRNSPEKRRNNKEERRDNERREGEIVESGLATNQLATNQDNAGMEGIEPRKSGRQRRPSRKLRDE